MEDLVCQLNRFVYGVAGWYNLDVYLFLSRQSDTGNEAGSEVDQPSIEAWRIGERIEHMLSVGE